MMTPLLARNVMRLAIQDSGMQCGVRNPVGGRRLLTVSMEWTVILHANVEKAD